MRSVSSDTGAAESVLTFSPPLADGPTGSEGPRRGSAAQDASVWPRRALGATRQAPEQPLFVDLLPGACRSREGEDAGEGKERPLAAAVGIVHPGGVSLADHSVSRHCVRRSPYAARQRVILDLPQA